MNPFAIYHRSARFLAMGGLLLALVAVGGCGKPPAPATPVPAKPKIEATKAGSATVAPASLSNEYVSVFEDTLLAPKGRDPFFPDSKRRNPVPVVIATAPVHQDPVLVLTAVIRTAHHSQAVINHAFMEVGEEQSIRTPPEGHLVKVKCLEIGNDYAVVQIEGEAPKKLVMEKRKGIEGK